MPAYELATRAEIEAILDRAIDLLGDLLDDDPFLSDPEVSRGIECAIEALRFCAVAAGALGDPALGGVVVDVVGRLRAFHDEAEDHHTVSDRALTTLLAAGLRVDRGLRELVEAGDASLRVAVARGLRPWGEAERALLATLAADPVAAVRNAARRSLASAGDVPWWAGKWKSDPAARLLPGEAEALGPVLARVSEALDGGPHRALHGARLAELVDDLDRLPDELAVEAIEGLCRSAEHGVDGPLEPLFARMVARRGGLAAVERLIDLWARSDKYGMSGGGLGAVVARLPGAARLAVCRALVALVARTPAAERAQIGKSPSWLAASIVAQAWPPEQGIRELLDVILAAGAEELPEHQLDHARLRLADALALPGVDPSPVLDELVEARVAGYPGPWAGLWIRADKLLDEAPPHVLRRAAERALDSDDPSPFTIRWAATRLLGPLFDPAIDGEPLERVRAILADPRRRAALIEDRDFVQRALPVLRAALLRDELTYPDAVATMEGIGQLYGGLAGAAFAGILARRNRMSAEKAAADRLAAQDAIHLFLGPPELRGPPSEAEREALRRARARHGSEDIEELATLWSRTLASGAWTAEERADLDAYYALLCDGHGESLAFALGTALAAKPDADLLPRFDEVVRRSDEDTRPLMKRLRAATRDRLGLAEDTAPEPAAGPGAPDGDDDLPGGAWDDDDDEDDSGSD